MQRRRSTVSLSSSSSPQRAAWMLKFGLVTSAFLFLSGPFCCCPLSTSVLVLALQEHHDTISTTNKPSATTSSNGANDFEATVAVADGQDDLLATDNNSNINSNTNGSSMIRTVEEAQQQQRDLGTEETRQQPDVIIMSKSTVPQTENKKEKGEVEAQIDDAATAETTDTDKGDNNNDDIDDVDDDSMVFSQFVAHNKTMTCTADEHARMFNNQVRGVNLGGWMVLEPWITPSLFYQFLGGNENTTAFDTYTFCQVLGPKEANRQLRRHWARWVTEDIIKTLASSGAVNSMRVPVGDYMYKPYGPYAVQEDGISCFDGALDFVDVMLDWAYSHGLTVMVCFLSCT
jgi:hypothetical protein